MKISVIIPAYNLESYLARTLDSVFAQTSLPDEVIVIDDGSQDRTVEIARHYPVSIIQQENQGAAVARNRGIQAATGDWIVFLDGDDAWVPERIAELRKAIQENPEAVLIANDEYEGPLGGPWLHKPLHERFDPHQSAFLQLFRSCFLSTSAVAVKRATVLAVGGMNENLRSAQDYDLWLRVSLQGRIAFIPKPLSYYILREESISGDVEKRLQCLLSIIDSYFDHVTFAFYFYRITVCYYEAMRMYGAQRKWKSALACLFRLPIAVLSRLRRGKKVSMYRLAWDSVDFSAWDCLLREVQHSNLLQTWSYGVAKSQTEGWKVKRGVIYQGARPVAILQALEKKLSILGKLVRVNRGPLFLKGTSPSLSQVGEVYRLISREFRWWKRQILVIAPELEKSSENHGLLLMCGYRAMKKKPQWSSSRLDLSQSEEELRKSLKGKWRNMVSFAERAGLRLEISDSEEAFSWLMARYQQFMAEKSFTGTPIPLLVALREKVEKSDYLLVFRAFTEQRPVGGILIAQHGLECTYWVGYTDLEGKKLKASNFLLWSAVVEMKRRGCQWLDLGGLDDKNTPQIAEFKRGMSGKEYGLVGEYFRV